MDYPWLTLMPLEWALEGDPEVKSLFHPPGDSMLFVNGTGRRTLNEKGPYNETAQMLQRWDARRARYSDLFQFMVWDQDTQDIHSSDRPASPIRPTGEPAPHVVTGETLAELAAEPARAASRSSPPGSPNCSSKRTSPPTSKRRSPALTRAPAKLVTRTSSAARCRSSEPSTRCSPAASGTSETHCSTPFGEEGPYYATIIVPAALDTKGGPPTNASSEILDRDSEPRAGPLRRRNCVASPAGKAYWAAGGTIGPAVTFGYLAGKHAARAKSAPRQIGATA